MAVSLNKEKTAVVVVDVQADFTQYKNGSLAVEGTGAGYVETVRKASEILKKNGFKLFATKDFHPENHMSFYTNNQGASPMDIIEINGRNQVMWPPHCVTGTPGAELLINDSLFDAVVKKGCDSKYDSYSGFFDDGGADTGLSFLLKSHGINNLLMYGLATDYCVKATAMDAVKQGFFVSLVKDLCRGVAPDTTASALTEMQAVGIGVIETYKDLV